VSEGELQSDVPSWQEKAQADRRALEDALFKAGADGLTRQQLQELVSMGKERFDNALQLLGGPPLAERTKERRPDRRGHLREQVVFRHSIANENGAVPASVTRDPDVRAMLAELALIEAVAQAKAAGRRNPRAIARWIIADPSMSKRVADWIDLETPLAKRVEALDESS